MELVCIPYFIMFILLIISIKWFLLSSKMLFDIISLLCTFICTIYCWIFNLFKFYWHLFDNSKHLIIFCIVYSNIQLYNKKSLLLIFYKLIIGLILYLLMYIIITKYLILIHIALLYVTNFIKLQCWTLSKYINIVLLYI